MSAVYLVQVFLLGDAGGILYFILYIFCWDITDKMPNVHLGVYCSVKLCMLSSVPVSLQIP